MKWDSHLLSNVNMGKARRVRNNGIGDEWIFSCIKGLTFGVGLWWSQAIPSLNARSPAPHKDLFNPSPALAHFATGNCIESGDETRVFDHERHELCRVTANTEEFKAMFLNKTLKGRMSSDSNSMTVFIFERFSQGDKGLNVTPRTDDLNDEIKSWGRGLVTPTTIARRDVVWGREGEVDLGLGGNLVLERRS